MSVIRQADAQGLGEFGNISAVQTSGGDHHFPFFADFYLCTVVAREP
jgi:hypothetical protein